MEEEETTKARILDRDSHLVLTALGHVFDALGRFLELSKTLFQDGETLFQARQAFRRFGNPVCRRRRDADSDASDGSEEHQDHQEGSNRPWKVQAGEGPHAGLQQEVEDERENNWKRDLTGEVKCVEAQQDKDAKQK